MISPPTPEPPESPRGSEAWSPTKGKEESFGGWHKVAAVHRYIYDYSPTYIQYTV